MKKAVDTLLLVWLIIIPMFICTLIIITGIWLYVELDDEGASLYLNIACLLSCLWLVGYIIELITAIIREIKTKKLRNTEGGK